MCVAIVDWCLDVFISTSSSTFSEEETHKTQTVKYPSTTDSKFMESHLNKWDNTIVRIAAAQADSSTFFEFIFKTCFADRETTLMASNEELSVWFHTNLLSASVADRRLRLHHLRFPLGERDKKITLVRD